MEQGEEQNNDIVEMIDNTLEMQDEYVIGMQDEYVIGIDLGTTNTCVGIWRNGGLEIIPDEYGNRTIPSFVAYTNVNRYIGLDAKNQKDLNPSNVFYEVKRLIGRKIDDPLVTREREFFSYQIDCDEFKNIVLVPNLNNKKVLTVEEISAAILTKAKYMASNYLHQKITKCVITIPAYFNDGQRQATKDAALIAGLDCVRIINEPTAAALAYGLLQRTKTSNEGEIIAKNIMVYDFGGGTLDVSLVRIEDGIFEVLSSCGNMRMGGSDFDNRLISYAIGKFKKMNNIQDIDKLSNVSLQKLRLSCEQAKKILSNSMKTQIAVKNFYKNKDTDLDLFIPITRVDFEKICTDLFLISLKPIDDVLKNCDFEVTDIDEIILVGGMTRMPKIRELIKVKFNKEPNCTINPEEAVAAGATIQGYLLSHADDPFSEAVTLLDTIALSLGVETIGGVMDTIIERGTIIPTNESKSYTTDKDYVDNVLIKIYEGERRLTKDNFFVGEFELYGIQLEPRGIPEIDVIFNIDNNGIITVTAENKKTNEKNSLTVTSNKGRLTKAQIDELITDAKELEYRDELEKRKKWMHYEVDDFCNNILMNIKNKEFKLSDVDRQTIEQDIKKVLSWLSEKKYDEREDEDYEKVIKSIKNQYGVLILTGNMEQSNVKSMDGENKDMTTIYGNDNDEDEQNIKQVFENIEEDTCGYKGLSEPEKAELKELRQAISDMCYSIFDIISSGNLKISNNHMSELKDYIDDSLLWLHVHEKPGRTEYKIKIDEINETCNKIFNHYKESEEVFKKNELVNAMKTVRDELENECLVLQLLIQDDAFPINKKFLVLFSQHITTVLEWIGQKDLLYKDNDDKTEYYTECETKLANLRIECEAIQQKMQGINLDKMKDILGDERIILTGYVENENNGNEDNEEANCGTDIITLMRKKQQDLLSEMINCEENENTECENDHDENRDITN